MNFNPGDYFYHRVHGYQKVSHVRGGLLWFQGQPWKLVIKNGKTERERDDKFGPESWVKIPVSEAIACSEEEAHQATSSTMPETKESPVRVREETKQELKRKFEQLKAKTRAKTKKAIVAPKPVSEPPGPDCFDGNLPQQSPPPPQQSPEETPEKRKIPTPPRLVLEKQTERFEQLRDSLTWLDRQGLPAVPVAPIVKDKKFNSKNPSCLDSNNEPHQIKWRRFALGATPSEGEKAKWWANLNNGIGTFSGINNIYWIDIDRKHFESDESCKEVAMMMWEKVGGHGILEKTQSGGWRIAFKYHGKPFRTFSFSLEEGGPPVGEILGISKDGIGQFVVLAPSYGQLGNYETVKRKLDIPTIDLENLGIFKKYKKTYSATYDNRDFVRFPAKLYKYYGHPMKIWLLARNRDVTGSGRTILPLTEITGLTGRSESSVRRWITKGIKKGLFSARTFSKEGQIFVEIYYISKEKACLLSGTTDLGTVGLVNIKEDLEALHIVATDILALGIQKRSRHAQYQEQVKKVSQQLGVDEDIGKKRAIKPIKPEKLGKASGQPCENDMARVLLAKERFLLVSERFPAYGASLASVSAERGLSLKQTNRHLIKRYREVPSPARGFREDIKPIEKRQIIQRLARGDMSDRLYEGLQFEASQGELDKTGKYARDKSGRWWERKCCVMVPHFRLVSCRFRRWRLSKIGTSVAQSKEAIAA